MAWPIIVAWIHYVSIMLMVASLLSEHLLLKPEMDVAQARTLQRLDIVYGASATIESSVLFPVIASRLLINSGTGELRARFEQVGLG